MATIFDSLKTLFPREMHRRVFLVGGAVRDLLTGTRITDIDLAAALAPSELLHLGFRLVEGKSTAPIWHRNVAGLGTLEVTPLADAAELPDDLLRRDFTVNAMAMDLSGSVIDPLDARSDLKRNLLAPCSPHTFIDDPLRVFRAFRFASDGWHMTPECEQSLRAHCRSEDYDSIPVERFSREMLKALAAAAPDRFFRLMLVYGAGLDYLPELFRMPQIPAGPPLHHPEGDLFSHSIQVLQRLAVISNDPLTRFCAMFHDIGKLATAPALYPKHHGHELAGFRMAPEFCRRLRLPVDYGTALAWTSRLHGTINLWEQLRINTKLTVAMQAVKGGVVDILPLVAAADKSGGNEPPEWRKVTGIAELSAQGLGVDLDRLEQIAPRKRKDFILQTRIAILRTILKPV